MPSTKKKRTTNNKKKRRDEDGEKTTTLEYVPICISRLPVPPVEGAAFCRGFFHHEGCSHGCPPSPMDDPMYHSFLQQFMYRVLDNSRWTETVRGHSVLLELLQVPQYKALIFKTKTNDDTRSAFKSFLISLGVKFILNVDKNRNLTSETGKSNVSFFKRLPIAFAEAFLTVEAYEEFFSHGAYLAGSESSSERYDRWLCRKLRDLNGGCERTVIRVFAKRAPCSCLEDQLARVNQQPKIGACSWCRQQFEYQSLMKCDRCTLPHYCSRACQVDHWPEHKNVCKPKVRQRKPAAGQDEEEEDLEEIL